MENEDIIKYLKQMYNLWDQEMDAWKPGDNMYHYAKGGRDMAESALKQFGVIMNVEYKQTLDT